MSYHSKQIINTELEYSRYMNGCTHMKYGYPCGQCANCLAKRTNKWVARLMHQATISKFVLSFCLTYTDAMFLDYKRIDASPFCEFSDGSFGNKRYEMSHTSYISAITLSRRDVQLFIKRLRSKDSKLKFKYYVKGEYGDTFFRPHYHVLLFVDSGCPLAKEQVISYILTSWFDAIEKYDVEDYPNMRRKRNIGKVVGVNPIVSFGEFDEDCAKYCTKYVSKSLANELCVPAQLVSEFILCSNKMAVEFYRPQMTRKRMLFKQLAFKWFNGMDKSEFIASFKRVCTFVSNRGDNVFFPNFLYNEFFCGYYVYADKYGDEKQISDRSWHPAPGAKRIEVYREEDGLLCEDYLGRVMRDMYIGMLSEYVNYQRAEFFGLGEDEIFVQSDMVDYPMTVIDLRMKHYRQNEKNRLSGAYKHRQNNVKKRKNWRLNEKKS